ncbi:MAG: tRNA (adenosine(37)-N6)-threonylcarbamoyltransferase complex dimerization subunit type 1 TsaB [Thermoanaerobaculia bacterium]
MTENRTEVHAPTILAVDTGSPVVSVAVARNGEVLAERQSPSGRSSPGLVPMIDALLSDVDSEVGELDGILALRGPGSFTGLRVGLATCLGLHQALGVPATTLTTFEAIAAVSPEANLTVMAAVESIRQTWLVQAFRTDVVPESLGDPRILSTDELTAERVDLIIGFGLGDISMPANQAFRAAILEPPPLAGHALILQEHRQGEWDPSGLVRPLYLQALSAAQPATAA